MNQAATRSCVEGNEGVCGNPIQTSYCAPYNNKHTNIQARCRCFNNLCSLLLLITETYIYNLGIQRWNRLSTSRHKEGAHLVGGLWRWRYYQLLYISHITPLYACQQSVDVMLILSESCNVNVFH